ncbi:MAG: tRNA uridine-5-carboxymethylaminomethyl(34) synthesis GTPase MnmE [Alistipes sp.]|nr:tRNA uridine-5-carboxymethylaminomethyl(34) synthesis GTPase MnmE [Alistipes sp.]
MITEHLDTTTTIVAPATEPGGAVMVIRLSGDRAIAIADRLFRGRRPLSDAEGYTLHYGHIVDDKGETIDDVVVALFRAPHSYTGDDIVEITAHGSEYITAEILRLAIEYGAVMAMPGEFTRRAFLAGKMDLSRAEAVADIIASDSRWSHNVASTQMRGGYSAKLGELRGELLRLSSLLELELDFSEEDVEFADRSTLRLLLNNIGTQLTTLTSSFALGNVLKNGVTVAIIGKPNVGKSTLLNALVEDDRAMVSDIAGTTRDAIEATTVIDGIRYRFIDTAGIHQTTDRLEQMGIERTHRTMSNASIILHLTTADEPTFEDVELGPEQHYVRVVNKIDTCAKDKRYDSDVIPISAQRGMGLDMLRQHLRALVDTSSLNAGSVVVTNMRHYAALKSAHEALGDALQAVDNNLSGDLISEDIRRILHHLGEITGEITSDDILHTIFSHFCIGK